MRAEDIAQHNEAAIPALGEEISEFGNRKAGPCGGAESPKWGRGIENAATARSLGRASAIERPKDAARSHGVGV